MPTEGDERLRVHQRLRQRLSEMTDVELLRIAPTDVTPGPWGVSSPAELDGTTVFVKRVPLTDLEAARPGSTRNHFGLPTYYSYGVGSAGFGAWRELALHEMTADLPGFPALLHQRTMARTIGPGPLPWSAEEYVRYWNGSAAVGRFMQARQTAASEIWLVLEFVPQEMLAWLAEHQERVNEVLAQLFEHIAMLRSLGVVHFDAHLGNVVTDGERCRLTDFGLAMATGFELGVRERRFLDAHRHYDYGAVLGTLGILVARALGGKVTVPQVAAAIDDLDQVPLGYRPEMISVLRMYRAPILYMLDFFWRMRSPRKRSTYDDEVFADLLRAAHVPLA